MPLITRTEGLLLGSLAERVHGTVLGDKNTPMVHVCSFDRHNSGCLTFSREKRRDVLARALDQIHDIGAILVHAEAVEGISTRLNLVKVKDPVGAFAELVPQFFEAAPVESGISPLASVHSSSEIGSGTSIGAFTVVGPHCIIEEQVTLHPHVTLYPGVRIGARSIIHAGAVIREDCVLGADCIVQPGVVVGADGFGYFLKPGVGLAMVPQVGTVNIGNRVDLGANTCVDRATLGETSIKDGTKIDNLVQIGHNNSIGANVTICGQVGIAGSSTVGDFAVLGGQSGVADHVHVVAGVRLAGRGGITGDIKEKGDYGGFPAIPAKQWRRQIASAARAAKDFRPKDEDEA